MTIRTVNNFTAPLAADISSTATSVTLSTGYGASLRTKLGGPLASGDTIQATLIDKNGNIEIVTITSTGSAGDTLTVVRGQEGTTARAWTVLDESKLSIRITAGVISTLLDSMQGLAFKNGTGNVISTDTTVGTAHNQHWTRVTAQCNVTLPPLSSGSAGKTVYGFTAASGFYLKASGSELIRTEANGALSRHFVGKGRTLIVVHNGTEWHAVIDAYSMYPYAYDTDTAFGADDNWLYSWRDSAGRLYRYRVHDMVSGYHTIWIPAGGIKARSSNGAAVGSIETATNKVNANTLDFDFAANEYAQFSVRMPLSWDGVNVNAAFLWTVAGGTGAVVWGIQAVAMNDGAMLDSAFGTAQTVTDTVSVANTLLVSPTTGNISLSATPGSLVQFQIYRDAANAADTLNANDARLLGVVLQYRVNKVSDY